MKDTAIIALDIDNTLADTTLGIQGLVAQFCGVPRDQLRLSQSYRFPWAPLDADGQEQHADDLDALPRGCALDLVYREIWGKLDTKQAISPIPGARRLTTQLHNDGLLAGYITRRPAYQLEDTRAWLSDHRFPDAPLIHADAHQIPGQPATRACKTVAMRELGAMVLVDDSIHEVSSVLRSGLGAVLVNQPHNQRETLDHRYQRWGIRRHNLPDAINIARQMSAMLLWHELLEEHLPHPATDTTAD